jgi:ferritin-like metal-binding protein YciE
MSAIFQGRSPLTDEGDVMLETTDSPPEGGPIPTGAERPEEFAPGLTPELAELAQAVSSLSPKTFAAPRGTKAAGSKVTSMNKPRELFLSELADVYYTEKALEKVLPQLAHEASDKELANGFERHLERTRKHSATLEQVFETMGERAKAEPCPGIEGIKEEHDKFMAEQAPSPEIRDLFLTSAAARTEHYEIAAYTSLTTMAQALGEREAAKLLQANLRDEKQALKAVETVSKRLSGAANGSAPAQARRKPVSSPGNKTRRRVRS